MPRERNLATNRQARHNYQILQSLEAGIVLLGPEVKSLRQGRAQLRESYAKVKQGEVYLYGCHISPYGHMDSAEQEPLRVRKLLLHRREIHRLERETRKSGHTLVPLRFYLKEEKIKVELALARGKRHFDKREAARRRILRQEAERAMRRRP